MAEDGKRADRPAAGAEAGRVREQMRQALAEIEDQRDDSIVYLAAIRSVLDIVARGHGTAQCAQDVAEVIVRELAVDTCAVTLDAAHDGVLSLAGYATQGQQHGRPSPGFGENGWLALARLVGVGTEPTCFRSQPDGGFTAVNPGELSGEGYIVLPFTLGGEAGGALVLRSLVGPAQVFARGRALALVAEIVGQALTIARMRDGLERMCGELETEIGSTRRALSAHEESLRSHEARVEELTHDLIRSNRVKREFLATVSHELRTPLNAILGYSSLVRDGAAGPITGEQTRLLDRVLGNTRNLNALIDDILFFVQLEADRVVVRREPVPIAEVVEEVVTTVSEREPRDRVAFRVEVQPSAATLNVDAALVRRILFHLLGNAFKFTEQGEVRVVVRRSGEQGAAVIVVRDTGVGIAPERLDELFQVFQQGDGSTTRRWNGLGMGLTLVQRCVQLLGGEVAVESTPNVGSEFRVHLPGALGASAKHPDHAPPASRTVH
jgi:signal transduction histidine kinase